MIIKIDGVTPPVAPMSMEIVMLDLDNGETTARSVDGTLVRDRIAIKRQIKLEWGLLEWGQISIILKLLKNTFFEVYYPDPQEGIFLTKTFYCGNRPASIPFKKGEDIYWNGLNVTLIER